MAVGFPAKAFKYNFRKNLFKTQSKVVSKVLEDNWDLRFKLKLIVYFFSLSVVLLLEE